MSNRRLYWGQGQFLAPQHLQQQDLFHQDALRYAWESLRPFAWGLRRLRIREEGLAAYSLEILECEWVGRDGAILRAGSEAAGANARLAPRNFEKILDPGGAPTSVYLGVPKLRPGEQAVSGDKPAEGAPPRYRAVSAETADIFETDSPPADVSFLEFNTAVLFDREEAFAAAPAAYDLLKIAELVPLANAVGARLRTEFVPASLAISASANLLNRVKGVRDLLLSKGIEFAELKRQRGVRATAGAAQDALRMLMLQTLNRFTPALQQAIEIGEAHPEPVYALFRTIVAELSVFSEEIAVLGATPSDPRDLPPYDHEKLAFCYDAAIGRIQTLVRGMTTGPEAGIRLAPQGEYFQAKLPESVFAGERTRYYLMIDSLTPGPELASLLQNTGKISSLEEMPQLRKAAVFGLKIAYLPVPPEELPHRGGNNSYFAVDTNSPQWKRIRDAGNIAVFCKLDPQETTIKLYVVREE